MKQLNGKRRCDICFSGEAGKQNKLIINDTVEKIAEHSLLMHLLFFINIMERDDCL